MAGRVTRLSRHLRERTRRHFITGLLVIVPLWMTWYVLASLVRWIDRVLAILPKEYRPEAWLPFPVPGLGLMLTLLVIQFVGIMGANLIGRSFVNSLEKVLGRIPVVRGIYGSVQQVLRQLVAVDSNKFHKVVLMRYPGETGIYRIGFVTGEREMACQGRDREKLLHVFLPNSPNIATGHFFLATESQVQFTDITTEQALRMIMSGGLVDRDDSQHLET
ncbi:MAG: DUF502 domain-containing protein [Chitinivibrionia bacterium]|nr:DUF502 domain-containing protein [Chitinivibrionia bacterium]